MTNSLCTECRKWIHERCLKLSMPRHFTCGSFKKRADKTVEPVEELCYGAENVKGLCYLGN